MKRLAPLALALAALLLNACGAIGGAKLPPRPEANPSAIEGTGSVWECTPQGCRKTR